MKVKVYVEGGGDSNALRTACRRAFAALFGKAGFDGSVLRVVACGRRGKAYKDFCTAMRATSDGGIPLLLVDSEAPVAKRSGPWDHLQRREQEHWSRPPGARDDQAHLMVQCMDAWFLADKEMVAEYFGHGFREGALPKNPDIEEAPKQDVLDGLEKASRSTTKGRYSKGRHSFELLARLSPDKLSMARPHAKRLFDTLRRVTSPDA